MFRLEILLEEVTHILIPDVAGFSKIRLLIHLLNVTLPKIKQLSCPPPPKLKQRKKEKKRLVCWWIKEGLFSEISKKQQDMLFSVPAPTSEALKTTSVYKEWNGKNPSVWHHCL